MDKCIFSGKKLNLKKIKIHPDRKLKVGENKVVSDF